MPLAALYLRNLWKTLRQYQSDNINRAQKSIQFNAITYLTQVRFFPLILFVSLIFPLRMLGFSNQLPSLSILDSSVTLAVWFAQVESKQKRNTQAFPELGLGSTANRVCEWERAHLSLHPQCAGRHQGFPAQDAGVIHKVAGRHVVRTVRHNVIRKGKVRQGVV